MKKKEDEDPQLNSSGGDLKLGIEILLRQSRENLEFALESAGVGTWDIDLKTNKVSCSKEMLTIWGLTRQDPDNERSTLQSRVHPDDVAKMNIAIDSAIKRDGIYDFEFRIHPEPGVERWVRSRGRCVHDPVTHKPIRFAGVVCDVTAQKLIETELRRSKELAEQANLAKTQFLANMSHELRTPIGAILGFVDMLKEGTIGLAERQEFASIIERNSENLLRLIDDILDLSKVEAGHIALENSTFNLVGLLFDFTTTMKLKAKAKGIEFNLNVEGAIPGRIFSDQLRLRQIMANLVNNALKFTDSGVVELTVKFEGPFLKFIVSDSGPGVSDDARARLFQPFGQGDPSLTREHGGTGLGLVLAKRLAEVMGGDIELAKTELGKGSTFVAAIRVMTTRNTVMVTSREIENGAQPKPPAQIARKLEGMTVLLIEDLPDNRKLVGAFLSGTGANVEMAVDGLEGVEKAIKLNPDVILMDIQMPHLDGLGATRRLRESGFSKPIIALTAHAMRDERERCFQSGCNDFLAKPIERSRLVDVLSRYWS